MTALVSYPVKRQRTREECFGGDMRQSEDVPWVGVVLLNVQLWDGDVPKRGMSRSVAQGAPQKVETVDVLALIAAHELEMARGDGTRPFAIPSPYDQKETG